jgi:hypothetical protein
MTDETHRFFRFSGLHQASYDELTEKGNEARNLPDGEGTERWLASWEKLFLDPETGTDKLYCVKRSGILPTDQFDLEGIEEINLETYLQRLQWEPPIEEDLEMLDELEILD